MHSYVYIAYAMPIWAPLIPATRWSCSRSPADTNDCRLQLHLVARIRVAQVLLVSITFIVLSELSLTQGVGWGGGDDRQEHAMP